MCLHPACIVIVHRDRMSNVTRDNNIWQVQFVPKYAPLHQQTLSAVFAHLSSVLYFWIPCHKHDQLRVQCKQCVWLFYLMGSPAWLSRKVAQSAALSDIQKSMKLLMSSTDEFDKIARQFELISGCPVFSWMADILHRAGRHRLSRSIIGPSIVMWSAFTSL